MNLAGIIGFITGLLGAVVVLATMMAKAFNLISWNTANAIAGTAFIVMFVGVVILMGGFFWFLVNDWRENK